MRQYETFELAFSGAAPKGSEAQVNQEAVFENGETKVRAKGFYAGNSTYKVRLLFYSCVLRIASLFLVGNVVYFIWECIRRKLEMASKVEFVEFVVDQLQEAGTITYKKMFGEYGLYCNGKIFSLICDDQFFVKITKAGRETCPGLMEAPPYEGAKNYFLVEDVEDRETLTRLVVATCSELPEPKPKKPKTVKTSS